MLLLKLAWHFRGRDKKIKFFRLTIVMYITTVSLRYSQFTKYHQSSVNDADIAECFYRLCSIQDTKMETSTGLLTFTNVLDLKGFCVMTVKVCNKSTLNPPVDLRHPPFFFIFRRKRWKKKKGKSRHWNRTLNFAFSFPKWRCTFPQEYGEKSVTNISRRL